MKKGKVAYWMGRGFTLVELMVVVIIVGVLAAIIIPTASKAMRARRGSGAASHIAFTYRLAKMRAMGRGAAVLVRYSGGMVQTYEAALDLTPGNEHASTSCILPANRWTSCLVGVKNAACVSIDSYKASGEDLNYKFLGAGNAETTDVVDICFTPAGQAYYRTGTTTFASMTGVVPQIQVWVGEASSASASMVHTVFVLPNGAARVVARQGS